jgi:hypothetical protein
MAHHFVLLRQFLRGLLEIFLFVFWGLCNDCKKLSIPMQYLDILTENE